MPRQIYRHFETSAKVNADQGAGNAHLESRQQRGLNITHQIIVFKLNISFLSAIYGPPDPEKQTIAVPLE